MSPNTPSRWIIAVALALSAPLAAAPPATVNIRLGTLAPDNSPWTNALRSMGATWGKDTANRVRLVVGPVPSDSEAIARMAVDGLQAATIFVAGLGEIDPAFNVFWTPFFFESDAELEHVQQQLAPMLAQKLAARKLRLLSWGNGGWVRLFSKKPLRSIADVQAAKLYTTAGDAKSVQWYAKSGFNAVALTTSQIPAQLLNPVGLINAAPSPPVYAVATGMFKNANYMLDVRLGPFTAATIITEAAWSRISAEDQVKMQQSAAAMQSQVNAAAPALDARYIEEMKKAGLNIVSLDATELAQFRATADKLILTQRDFLVPADAFDAAVRARDAFRKGRR
jgi:TRAP-type C4-dicarboxylate transport system substrate-binding protein